MNVKERIETINQLVKQFQMMKYDISSNLNELKAELKEEIRILAEQRIQFERNNINQRIIIAIDNEIDRLRNTLEEIRNCNISIHTQVKWTSEKVEKMLEGIM